MRNGLTRFRLYTAGILAFLLGVPMTEKAFAQVGDILYGSLSLASGIASASDGS